VRRSEIVATEAVGAKAPALKARFILAPFRNRKRTGALSRAFSARSRMWLESRRGELVSDRAFSAKQVPR